jgi:cytoskeleton-associated protein 5
LNYYEKDYRRFYHLHFILIDRFLFFSREFGSKVLPIKPFLKQVIPLLEDRDKTVRDEAKLLLVEIYKWIGKQTLTPMIQNVKPIQVFIY